MVSLGCARNIVDSEFMLGQLTGAGWTVTQTPAEADVIIINTCSFIESAVDESVDTILELAKLKKHGSCQRLIVAGCLPERFREDIVSALPEVDVFLGTGAFDKIVQAVGNWKLETGNWKLETGNSKLETGNWKLETGNWKLETRNSKLENRKSKIGSSMCLLPDPNLSGFGSRVSSFKFQVSSFKFQTYLKIAEGCNRHCTYCIIPKLRGKQRSRPVEDIVAEARFLIESGVKELTLVAQDTTNYGKDLNQNADLGRLLEEISDISESVWIRFLYGHPDSISESVIRTVSERHNICAYYDIPIQHASAAVLKQMGRNYSRESLYRLFDNIRFLSPDASLRTTVIVGFPGETDADFELLLRFAEDVRFDNLGTFIYSDSEDLASHQLPGHVPKNVAQERYDRLMSCQLEISSENNEKYLGKNLTVLVEEKTEENLFTGRTAFQAPEVDGITYIRTSESSETEQKGTGELEIGSFVSVKITDTLEYDLIGESL
ncbi:Ribosomal protein S12 methylthiotransferase RimO [Desulfonema magnum]|uniref:Ribosomal protein uS12 methylthiotransferase RimO n=1 Tax=Desulfonema magnum TaxID=45655 RepID=A0A975GSU7_9BACT|nr:Ribosomal protein S12 methylthiotransferase RimO [Desulfonema magnum]